MRQNWLVPVWIKRLPTLKTNVRQLQAYKINAEQDLVLASNQLALAIVVLLKYLVTPVDFVDQPFER